MTVDQLDIKGLTDNEVILAREKHGRNTLNYKKENSFLDAVKRTIKEPMMILLLVAASIYFISGNIGDGFFLSGAIIFQTAISLFQFSRSKNALEKLKEYSQPTSKVIRNGSREEVKSEDLVIGDSLIVEEGTLVAADAVIQQSNDFSVNESILTGESFAVSKDNSLQNNLIYSGTTVASGLAVATITAVGNNTKLGLIGKSLESISEERTPLEKQIGSFVKMMAISGAIVFLIVWALNYWHSRDWLTSLLQSLTLAMSILPEEIPVAFTTFMALGAWRLMKIGIVVKQMKTVETLGSATVICTDKTGTITENEMSFAKLYLLSSDSISDIGKDLSNEEKELVRIGMFASEPIPFDPMELALHEAYGSLNKVDERPNYTLKYEYALEGIPPMMTHVFEDSNGNRIVAAKGAPEAIIRVSSLNSTDQDKVHKAMETMASEGYRILGVGYSKFDGVEFPKKQQDLAFEFIGIVAFYDPPKDNIKKVLEDFYGAGISVKIITGDSAATTVAIAKQVGFIGFDSTISGADLMKLSDADLDTCVNDTQVFTRMFPDAKLRIIEALKKSNQIVAMVGDGVNDGPALKAAHIGIAMGKEGSELAKQAASLILLEDDFSKMVNAVAMGRKIYANLKKAIRYIISIHIPIILIVFVPLALGWVYPNIFSPIHIIFLEIVMGPTCSIMYENEPMEQNTMLQKPKAFTANLFNWKELLISIVQGLIITIGALFIYQYAVMNDFSEALTRTMIFVVLVSANILLTLVNRSFFYSILTTLRYKNNLVVIIISITLALVILILAVGPITVFFDFERMSFKQLLLSTSVGFVSVIWFEMVKFLRRMRKR
ncbi:MAG: cation-translocating P-type ATPase [Flavobacteriales bacterium]